MTQIVIKSVSVETVTKGRNNWQKAAVEYTQDGKPRNQNLVSFKNPAVFAAVKDLVDGDVVDVTLTKEGDFWQWAAVKKIDSPPSAPASGRAPAASGGKVVGSNYETKEERAARQVLIVKQSSLAQALAYMSATDKEGTFGVNHVLDIAQQFSDWVFDKGDLFDEPNDILED